MVRIHNGILLSHKKEGIWVSSNEVDEPTACYTEWNKSEREKQIFHMKADVWNLERWYWWTCLQGSHGCTENRVVDTAGLGRRGWGKWRVAWKHTHCWVASVLSNSVRPRRRQPTRLCCLWDFPGKSTGMGCYCLLHHAGLLIINSFSSCLPENGFVCACTLSHFSHPQLFTTLWTVAYQVPLSMGFSRPEYWSGFPYPSEKGFISP